MLLSGTWRPQAAGEAGKKPNAPPSLAWPGLPPGMLDWAIGYKAMLAAVPGRRGRLCEICSASPARALSYRVTAFQSTSSTAIQEKLQLAQLSAQPIQRGPSYSTRHCMACEMQRVLTLTQGLKSCFTPWIKHWVENSPMKNGTTNTKWHPNH